MAFNGYYLRIGDCTFQDPPIKRGGFHVNPQIVQVTENKVLASGELVFKVLPHKPTKITADFPIMKPEQWRNYCRYFRGTATGEPEMGFTVEYYDEERDGYFSGKFYHGDLDYIEEGWFENGTTRRMQSQTVTLTEL